MQWIREVTATIEMKPSQSVGLLYKHHMLIAHQKIFIATCECVVT